jgi:hypothetical protein
MADFLLAAFGPTLHRLFFAPFHELYTAGLWKSIAPQDGYKTPIDREAVLLGAQGQATSGAGYNVRFRYPVEGLGELCSRLAARCEVRYDHAVEAIDLRARRLHMRGGGVVDFHRLVSTLPLSAMLRMTAWPPEIEADPYTSVLVLNIGARRGDRCPTEHWVYVPGSRSGFHRIGFYSNVDEAFLPQGSVDRVSIYVERSFRSGQKPSDAETAAYADSVLSELRDWGFIRDAEVVSPSWVEHAYTWTIPGSRWRKTSIEQLEACGIRMAGRYGTWHFQGIADSIRDGLAVGSGWRSSEGG